MLTVLTMRQEQSYADERPEEYQQHQRILGRITGQYNFSPYLNLRIAIAGDYFRLDETRFRPSAGFAPGRWRIRSLPVKRG